MDINSLDAEEHKSYIIRRIFDIGSLEEVADVLNYYGDAETKDVLIKANSLTQPAFNMAKLIFKLQPTDFACFSKIQFMKEHSGYYAH